MKQMVFSFVEIDARTILSTVVHTEISPSDEEWAEYLAAVRRNELNLGKIRTLVFTDGGGPNSTQRKAVNDFLKGRQTPVVLVSASPVIRGITTALNWFNPLVKSVSPEQMEEALKYLNIPPQHRLRALQEIKRLHAELGRTNLKTLIR